MELPTNPPADQSPTSDEQRQAKIASLKKAVADGTYHIPADQLADKLIDHMLDPKG
jgi:anti-sigma28 factor (negative regulator of flagellin synthesis)